ncbi:NfeD family protein [Oceanobacillus halophilus]|uniref:Nodulation protein NfeD n=1 Tax=Oceanobacillus halophilus TaxID=930130 RepID=A0A495ADG8_9BACI|nr:nodulation protein NfeD [Oceanobacillus halophilus]RKQ38017.1 nodulation protein NfeD [Oceanobacillus halophilus]
MFVASLYNIDNIIHADKEEGGGHLVYVIPIEREVERGLEAFLDRTTQEAIEAGADHIIFEIDTPGGRVDSAGQIGSLLQNLQVPTTSFIVNEALSAGSYIALNTDNIYFVPHATMGSSGVINSDGTAANDKAQSAWKERMIAAAESKGRDPLYAEAMADSSIDLPEYGAPDGSFLTLGPNDAIKVGYAEGIVDDRIELLYELNLSSATVEETEPSLAEEVARFLTNPVVYSILLSIASLGLIVELYSPGFGVPGIMGITALILFFYGHIVAGLAGMEAIVLLLLGIILIIAEFFVPGGILGLIGVGAILASLLMSGYDVGQMAMSLGIAFLVAIIASIILFRRIGLDKGVFRHIILRDSTTTDLGYVSSENRLDLIGLEGVALTALRPSGIGEFDRERLDVVSEGSFIDKGTSVKIVNVEGARIVVREIS